MKAGFALAALLLDDRALALVAPALPPELLPALRAELSVEARGSAREQNQAGGPDDGVAALLRVLQPELTQEAVNQLPPRMRALLARLLPPGARKALSADTPRARHDFVLDEPLLRVLVRLARRPTGSVPP